MRYEKINIRALTAAIGLLLLSLLIGIAAVKAFNQTEITGVELICPDRINTGAIWNLSTELDVATPTWLPNQARECLRQYKINANAPKWSSADSKIVTVDKNGKLIAVGEGNTVVSAKINGTVYEKEVSVGTFVDEIFTDILVIVNADGSDEATASVKLAPVDARLDCLTYTMKDESVATVDEDGIIKGVSNGKTVLKIEAPNGVVTYVPVISTSIFTDTEKMMNDMTEFVISGGQMSSNDNYWNKYFEGIVE